MQVSDMKALRLRALCIHKHRLCPAANRNPIPNPLRISSQSLQNASFSPNFHSTGLSFDARNEPSSDPKPPRVWTVYDPLSGRTVTQKVRNDGGGGGGGLESEAQKGSSSNGGGVEEYSPEERTYGSVRKAKAVSLKDIVVGGNSKKKGKLKTLWVCSSCGHTDGQWWGMCRGCDAPGTMTEVSEADSSGGKIVGVSEKVVGSWLPKKEGEMLPTKLKDVQRGISHQDWRISL